MKLFSKIIVGLSIPHCGCAKNLTALEARITDNLKVIVLPVQELSLIHI